MVEIWQNYSPEFGLTFSSHTAKFLSIRVITMENKITPLVGTLIGESIASLACYKRRSPPSEVVRQTECQYRKKS